MKVMSYTVCHYGADYIGWALRSVFPFVDVAHIFYTPHPSHGYQSSRSCPEHAVQLFEAAKQFDYDNKIRWHQMSGIFDEGPQRDTAVKTVRESGADIILVLDVDEVWHAAVLEQALEKVITSNNARNWLINFTHLWRSFNWCCKDNGWPVRFIDLRHNEGTAYIPAEFGDIYHFGYAVRNNILEYKMQIHGHKSEFRPNWIQDKWYAWQPGVEDVHPTNEKNWWNPEPFDKGQLPEFMQEHPFWDKSIIR